MNDPIDFTRIVDGTVRASFLPTTPTGRLTYRFAGGRELEQDAFDWPLRFAAGDGPGVFSVSFTEETYSGAGDGCEMTFSRTVMPIARGHLPTVALARRYHDGSIFNEATFELEYEDVDPYAWVRLTVRSGDCDAAIRGATTITVSSGGRTRRDRLFDPCGRWARAPRKAGRYSVVTHNSGEEDATWDFIPAYMRRNTRQIFSVTVSNTGRRLFSRRFHVQWKYRPDRHIDEAHDDFVNVCINDNIPIYKRRGRLYCTEPGYSRRRVTVTR